MTGSGIDDSGSVWLRGASGTVFAVRVGETLFVPGGEEGPGLALWVEGSYLCVDLHRCDASVRIARRFPLNLEPRHPASPFRGFTKTHHGDKRVVLADDPGVDQYVCEGEEYARDGVAEMSSGEFWQRAGL